ncbi:MAG: hypothetical protein MZU95_07980 [Desulfomicrobium escambiense]|nr:hypothetical protein [Desulfomicrobium escambiense]
MREDTVDLVVKKLLKVAVVADFGQANRYWPVFQADDSVQSIADGRLPIPFRLESVPGSSPRS